MQKFVLEEMCRADLPKESFEVAVLPIGACEVHAMHLPFGNDTLQVSRIARLAAEKATQKGAGVVVLPAIPFGCDQNLLAFPYTVSLQPTTILRIFDDLIASLSKHGLKKVLLLNGHGGNTGTLDVVLRELYNKHDVFIARLDWWTVASDVAAEVQETSEVEHADEIETSISLALFPDLVRMKAAEATSTNPSRLPLLQKHGGKFSRPWHLFTKNGGVGDPTKATREKGARIVSAAVHRIADILVELSAAEYDGKFPY